MKYFQVRLIVMLGVLSISTAAIMVTLSDATPLHNAFFRMLFSTLLLLPFVSRSRQAFKSISVSHLLLMMFSGISLGLHFYTWFISLEHTSIANSMVLISMSPLFTLSGGALIFGTKFSLKEVLITFIAIVGSLIMALHTGTFDLGEMYGNGMALLGAFLIAVYLLIGRYCRKSVTTTTYTFIVYSFATLSLGLITLRSKVPLMEHSLKDWLIFLLLAIVPTLLGHSLFSYALKYVKAAFISTVVLFEPVITIVLAMFIFQVYPDLLQIIGGSIILLTLLISIRGNGQLAERDSASLI